MANDLVLPDEYDRINLDLAPFFALPRKEMKRRMQMLEDMPETFTLVVKNGEVEVQASLIQEWQKAQTHCAGAIGYLAIADSQIKDDGGLEWEGTMPRANGTAGYVCLPALLVRLSSFCRLKTYAHNV